MKTTIVHEHQITITLSLVEFVALYDKVMKIGSDVKGPADYRKARAVIGDKLFTMKDETLAKSWPDQSKWDTAS